MTEELPARPSMADERGGQREREREGEIGEREREECLGDGGLQVAGHGRVKLELSSANNGVLELSSRDREARSWLWRVQVGSRARRGRARGLCSTGSTSTRHTASPGSVLHCHHGSGWLLASIRRPSLPGQAG